MCSGQPGQQIPPEGPRFAQEGIGLGLTDQHGFVAGLVALAAAVVEVVRTLGQRGRRDRPQGLEGVAVRPPRVVTR
jgi:hypothetical protein